MWDGTALPCLLLSAYYMYLHLRDGGVGGTAVLVTGEKGLGWRL